MSILLTGCRNQPKFTVDEILKYMSDKYGEEFTYIEPVDKNQPTKYSLSIYLKSEKYPDKKIFAQCIVSDVGEKKVFLIIITLIVYEEETREYITQIVNKVYPNAKVRYIVDDNISTSYTGNMSKSLKESISENPLFSFTVLLEPSHDIANKEIELKKLCDELQQEQIACSFSVRYSDDQDAFDTFKVDEYKPFVQKFDATGSVNIDKNYDVSYIKWR